RNTFGTEEQIEELHTMHRQGDKIQGSRYKGTNDKDRQWSTIQIKSDRSIHFFLYQEIRPHGSLGYKTPNEYDEYSREIGCEKGAINRVVIVKK
ncbi:MAG TPA: hypothetical protein PKI14_11830, partial [Fervidobacterium sp.]|nr:hypothetical protein [Fervidobacterium sp.]